MSQITLNVNGAAQALELEPDMPLLYALRNHLNLNGAKYGCGLGQCGACTVIVDDQPVFACLTPCAGLEGKNPHSGKPRQRGKTWPFASGVHREASRAMRLLHCRHVDARAGVA